MTIRDRVLEAIKNEAPGNLTNQQLATRLGLNEPSVRVQTKQLARQGFIFDYDGGYSGLPIQWRYRSQVETGASAPAGVGN